MRKILLVAKRDFLATVVTKGFIIAMMVPPLIYGAIIVAFPRMMSNRVPAVTGRVTVIDQTGKVSHGIRRYLEPEAIASRRDASFSRAVESSPIAGAAGAPGGAAAPSAVLGEVPNLEIVESPLTALAEEKERLVPGAAGRQLAVLVIHPHAVLPNAEGVFGAYELVRAAQPR